MLSRKVLIDVQYDYEEACSEAGYLKRKQNMAQRTHFFGKMVFMVHYHLISSLSTVIREGRQTKIQAVEFKRYPATSKGFYVICYSYTPVRV